MNTYDNLYELITDLRNETKARIVDGTYNHGVRPQAIYKSSKKNEWLIVNEDLIFKLYRIAYEPRLSILDMNSTESIVKVLETYIELND